MARKGSKSPRRGPPPQAQQAAQAQSAAQAQQAARQQPPPAQQQQPAAAQAPAAPQPPPAAPAGAAGAAPPPPVAQQPGAQAAPAPHQPRVHFAAPAAGPTLTFAELYQLSDTRQGDYRELMSHFMPTGTWDADRKLQDIVGLEGEPNAYIGLFEDQVHPEGRIRLLHCPQRYNGTLGRPTTLDGKVFAILDEIAGNYATFVRFPADAMAICADTDVPGTIADAAARWMASPNAHVLDPVATNRGRTAKAPYLMHVPATYIPLFMGRQLTPRDLVQEVLPEVENDGRVGQMQVFVDWCLIAGTAESVGGDHSCLLLDELGAPVADAPFLEWTRRTIARMLPDVAAAGMNATNAAASRIANIMTDVLAEQRAQRQDAQDARERDRSPRTVGEFFKEHATNKLMQLARVGTEEELPDLWAQVASATNKRDREAIEICLREIANELHIPELCPVVTPSLAKKVTSLRLAGTNLEDLEEGVNPFVMVIMDHSTESGEAAYQAAIEATHDYDDLMAGSGRADLTDLKTIKNSKVLIPETFELARAMLQAFKIVLIALLGEIHPVVVEYDRFLTAYINRESFYVGRLRRADGALGPARLLRYVQLAMRAWFQGVWEAPSVNAAEAVRTPPLREVLDKMMMGDLSWLPVLPNRYVQTRTPAGNTDTGKDPPKTKSTQVLNRNRNPRFDDFKLGIQRTKFNDAIRHAGTAPPNVTRNGEQVPMCASYQLRGSCFSNCSRSATHNKLSDAESDALYEWCKLAFE